MKSISDMMLKETDPYTDLINGVEKMVSTLCALPTDERDNLIQCLAILAYKGAQGSLNCPFKMLEEAHDSLVGVLLHASKIVSPEQRGEAAGLIVKMVLGMNKDGQK